MQGLPMRDRRLAHRHNPLPPGTRMFGLKIFLASLSVLFAASLVAYVLIRSMQADRGLPYGSLHLPTLLWLSTAVMLATSVTIHAASRSFREHRHDAFRKNILASAILAGLFLCIQIPSLYLVLQSHAVARQHNVFLYGLIVLLIALHALHVIGGLVPLGIVTIRAFHSSRRDTSNDADNPDTEYDAVRCCALYWHFLDIVWFSMFGTLFFVG